MDENNQPKPPSWEEEIFESIDPGTEEKKREFLKQGTSWLRSVAPYPTSDWIGPHSGLNFGPLEFKQNAHNGEREAIHMSHSSPLNVSSPIASKRHLSYVSLFSGAMGLDIGLERSGFNCVVCNEIDPLAVETIKLNKPSVPVIADSVEGVSLKTLSDAAGFNVKGIDLIAGGPPCQAFSVFGQRRGLHDGRGKLIFEFFRLVDEVRPKAFLMENVRGLHSMPLLPKGIKLDGDAPLHEHTQPGSLLREIIRLFEEIGYRIDCYLVNAVNYGAPQIRERLLCIGSRYDIDPLFTTPQFSNRPSDNLPPFRTLGDVIGTGFDDPDPSMMNFSPRKLKYLAMVKPGGNWRDLPEDVQKESMGKSWFLKGGRSAYWRKLAFEFPCPTVVTMPNHAGTSMCHPTELRALTVGEMAAVQEFPREWKFIGSPTDKCRQIGNAVPPRLGEVAGRVLKNLLEKSEAMNPIMGKASTSGRIIHLRPHVRTRSYFKEGEIIDSYKGYYDRRRQSDEQMQLAKTPPPAPEITPASLLNSLQAFDAIVQKVVEINAGRWLFPKDASVVVRTVLQAMAEVSNGRQNKDQR